MDAPDDDGAACEVSEACRRAEARWPLNWPGVGRMSVISGWSLQRAALKVQRPDRMGHRDPKYHKYHTEMRFYASWRPALLAVSLLAFPVAGSCDGQARRITGLLGCAEMEANEDVAVSMERLRTLAEGAGIQVSLSLNTMRCGYEFHDPRVGLKYLSGAHTDVELRAAMEDFFGLSGGSKRHP